MILDDFRLDGKAAIVTRARRAQTLSRIPMGRWGDPSELKGVAVFLASHASDYMTGQTVYVDGGYLIS